MVISNKLRKLLDEKGVIWNEDSKGININGENLTTYMKVFTEINSDDGVLKESYFTELKPEKTERCKECNSSNIKVYERSIYLPNELGLSATKHITVVVKFGICNTCKELFVLVVFPEIKPKIK